MKKLSELHKDEESCKIIFESIGQVEFEEVRRFDKIQSTRLIGNYNDFGYPMLSILEIFDDGCISLIVDGDKEDFGDVFKLVDLIRSLGYDK